MDEVSKFLRDNFFRVHIVYLSLFLFHFLVAWKYTRDFVHNDAIWVVLNQVERLSRNPELLFWSPDLIQYNFYTGNPFFLIPLFEIIGLSPDLMRAYLIGFMALSTVLAFVIYRVDFSFRESLIGVLMLLNFNFWIAFRYADYTYSIFFSLLVFYIYQVWNSSRSTSYLMLLASVSGLMFYFKALIGYIVIAIFIAHILAGREIRDILNPRTVLLAVVLLLIGLLPTLMYGVSTDFHFVDTLKEVDYDSEVDGYDIFDLLDKRLRDLTLITGLNNFPQLDWPSNIDLNFVLVLIPISAILCFYKRLQVFYPLFFAILFLLLLVVPKGMRWRQIVVLLPFIPLLLLSGYRSLREFSWGHRINFRIVSNVLILILAVSLIISVADMSKNVSDLPSYDKAFGGSQEEFKEFQELNIDTDILLTNSYSVFLYSKYDRELRSYFLVDGMNERYKDRWHSAELMKTNVVKDDKIDLKELDGRFVGKEIDILLIKDYQCDMKEEYCGAETEKVADKLDLKAKREVKAFNKNLIRFK